MPHKKKSSGKRSAEGKHHTQRRGTKNHAKIVEDSDDELLDAIIAENVKQRDASGAAAVNIVGRDSGNKDISAEEEDRRLELAKACQKKADEHIQQFKHMRAQKHGEDDKVRVEQQRAFDAARQGYADALFALAGSASTQELRLPWVLSPSGASEHILTPKLRGAAERLCLTVLSWPIPGALPFKAQVFAGCVGEALIKFAPDCTKGWQRLIDLNRTVGRYGVAIELLEQCVAQVERVDDDVQKAAYEQQIAQIQSEMNHVDGQMGETELLCPICLADCMLPERPENCPHVACRLCWFGVLRKKNPRCPVCRAPFSSTVAVSLAVQKEYYLGRLDRRLDDAVAWFNLAGTKVEINDDDERSELSKALQLFYEKRVSLPPYLRDVPNVFFAAEALRCSTPHQRSSGEMWNHFLHYFYVQTNRLILEEERRTASWDLGEELGGQLTLLEAAIAACETTESAWVSAKLLCLMCRDFATEVQNGTFNVCIKGKTYGALSLCDRFLEASNEGRFVTATTVRRLYVMYLTQTMNDTRNVHLYGLDKPRRVDAVFFYDHVFHCCVPFGDCEEFVYLAMGWRRLSLQQRAQILQRVTVSQGWLWGQAVEKWNRAEYPSVAAAMEEHERAHVGGKVLSKKDVLELEKDTA